MATTAASCKVGTDSQMIRSKFALALSDNEEIKSHTAELSQNEPAILEQIENVSVFSNGRATQLVEVFRRTLLSASETRRALR